MAKNKFAECLSTLLQETNTKSTVLANAVQYDLSYVSKWVSGKMLPSERNIKTVIDRTVSCLMKEDCRSLETRFACQGPELEKSLREELHNAFQACKAKKQLNHYYETLPAGEVVEMLNKKIKASNDVLLLADIMSLPHENRLALAGIHNGHFHRLPDHLTYAMIINPRFNECVYDSIFLIHMLTSMSNLNFKLYRNEGACGKLVCCMDDQVVSGFIMPNSGECLGVNELAEGLRIRQNIHSLVDQENLIFRKTSIANMIRHRDYIQTMISTNVRWILGHATELLLPEDVFAELKDADDRDTSEYERLYRLSQSIVKTNAGQIMIYESAIANLAVDSLVDFYNRPVKLTPDQVLRCLNYYRELMTYDNQIRLIDGNFSDDFRYITNPCLFLSDALCYIRLENNRYENNILILNDKEIKGSLGDFFAAVWSDRKDVVTDDKAAIIEKLDHFIESARILLGV